MSISALHFALETGLSSFRLKSSIIIMLAGVNSKRIGFIVANKSFFHIITVLIQNMNKQLHKLFTNYFKLLHSFLIFIEYNKHMKVNLKFHSLLLPQL